MPDSEFGSDGQLRDLEPSEPEFSAAERLRLFEDEHLGEDTPRFNGHVEKGHGSLFQRPIDKGGKLTDQHRKAHTAIEKTVETEHKLNEARGKLAQAEADHAAACKAADTAEASIAEPDASRDGSG